MGTWAQSTKLGHPEEGEREGGECLFTMMIMLMIIIMRAERCRGSGRLLPWQPPGPGGPLWLARGDGCGCQA